MMCLDNLIDNMHPLMFCLALPWRCYTPAMDPMSHDSEIDVSVVVAVYNERESISALHGELLPVLQGLNRSFEIIYVDDGSTDGTHEVLFEFFQANDFVRVLRFARKFGLETANVAGLHHVRGRRVVIIDRDLPVSLTHIPQFLERLDEGYDIVYADASGLKVPYYRRVGRIISTWLIRKMTDLDLAQSVSGIVAVTRDLVETASQYQEKKQYLDTLFAYLAYGRYSVVPVTPRNSSARIQRYTFWQLTRTSLSIVVTHSTKPLLIAFWAGWATIALSVLIGAFWLWRVLVLGWESGVLRLLIAITVFLAGVQFVALGVLGEYIGRIYGEVRRRPLYTVAEVYERPPNRAEDSPSEAAIL